LRALLDHLVAARFVLPLVPRLLDFVPNIAALMAALDASPSAGDTLVEQA
jgi:hypothetical protein